MNKKLTQQLFAAFTVAMLFSLGAMAQTNGGAAMPGASGDYANTVAEASTYITVGTTVPVYALPDPYYHPLNDPWNATPVYTLTAGFTWTWYDSTAVPALTFNRNDANDNYNEITAPLAATPGVYTVNVIEKAPPAYGGCDDGWGINLSVNVVAVPSFVLNGGDDAIALCEGDAGLPASVLTTIAGGWENFNLAWSLEIATLNAASAKEFYYDDENGTLPTNPQKYAVEYTQTTGGFEALAAASATHDIMTVGSFLAINNGTRDAVTVYTYTLASVNDRASRFGDFITLNGDDTDASAYTDYAATAAGDVLTVTVYPTPVTGPIYHINNAWAN